MAASRSSGFTLVEALVALAVLAIALAAASRAASVSTTSAAQLKAAFLAECVAESRMAELVLRRPWPALGAVEGSEAQAGMEFSWRAEVLSTPHPGLRRIEIQVTSSDAPDRVLRRLASLVANEGE